jgi:hypothetical protein
MNSIFTEENLLAFTAARFGSFSKPPPSWA